AVASGRESHADRARPDSRIDRALCESCGTLSCQRRQPARPGDGADRFHSDLSRASRLAIPRLGVGGGFRLLARLRKNRARESVEHARRAVARHVTERVAGARVEARCTSEKSRGAVFRRAFFKIFSHENFFARALKREFFARGARALRAIAKNSG